MQEHLSSEQLRSLSEQEGYEMQGYLVNRPVRAEDFDRSLETEATPVGHAAGLAR